MHALYKTPSPPPLILEAYPSNSMAMKFFVYLLFLSLFPSLSLSQLDSCSSQKFSANRLFSTCNSLPHLGASLHWTFDSNASTLTLAFVAAPAAPAGWVAWAINPTAEGMIGSQSLIAFRDADGKTVVKTYNISGYGPVMEGPISLNVSDTAAEYSGGMMTIFAKVKLAKGMEKVNQVWQVGASVVGGVPAKHAFAVDNMLAKGSVDFVNGMSTGGAGGADSRLRKKNIHGVLNAVSWGILLPIGAIFARYLKTFKSADPAWFYLHVSCQITGYAVGVAGWATGLKLGSESKGIQYDTHRNIGIALFCICTVQLSALFMRPNKDHKYRFYWNICHHTAGYSVIILSVINVFKGMQILQPLHKWKQAYVVVICILGGIAILLEVVTWSIVLKRKSSKSTSHYNGSNGVQQPLSV